MNSVQMMMMMETGRCGDSRRGTGVGIAREWRIIGSEVLGQNTGRNRGNRDSYGFIYLLSEVILSNVA